MMMMIFVACVSLYQLVCWKVHITQSGSHIHLYTHTHSIIVAINVQSKCQLKWPKPFDSTHSSLACLLSIRKYAFTIQSNPNSIGIGLSDIFYCYRFGRHLEWNGMNCVCEWVFCVLVREWMCRCVNEGLVSQKRPKYRSSQTTKIQYIIH